ncbi:MAG: GNAT family N-acetyltransferase [Coriobacteriales bacterium]|jgi:GNAT superfamily N-acetyltransferase
MKKCTSFDEYKVAMRAAKQAHGRTHSNLTLMSGEVKELIACGDLELELDGRDQFFLFRQRPGYKQLYFILDGTEEPFEIPSDCPVAVELPFNVGEDDPIPQYISEIVAQCEASGFSVDRRSHRMSLDMNVFESVMASSALGQETSGDTGTKTITRLSPEHAAEMLVAMNENFDYYWSYIPTPDEWDIAISEGRVLCHMDEGGKPDGLIHFDVNGKTSELRHLLVLPSARGRGLSKPLVSEYIMQNKDRVSRFYLWMRDDNAAAAHVYGSLGYGYDGCRAIELLKL